MKFVLSIDAKDMVKEMDIKGIKELLKAIEFELGVRNISIVRLVEAMFKKEEK